MTAAKPASHLRPLPVALCFVAGYVDACAFIALFGTFIAQITGTYIIAGVDLVRHDPGIIAKLLGIPVFMAGAALATVLARTLHNPRIPTLVIALILEVALLICFFAAGLTGVHVGPDSAANLVAAIAGFSAMGVQSALVRIFYAGAPSTNVMTTATSQIAIDAADVLLPARYATPARTAAARQRLHDTLPHVAAFLVGAIAGAVGYATLQWWSVAAAIAIVASAAAGAWIRRDQ